jgi:hypothetical protein
MVSYNGILFMMGKEGNEVGEIVKHWGGCREICGAVNDFKVTCK